MAAEKENCSNSNIRFFDYPEVSNVGQISGTDYRTHYGFWRKAEPEQLERFSAVGYYFAKELQAKHQVPIGIIGCNWGSTPACAWMSRAMMMFGCTAEEFLQSSQKWVSIHLQGIQRRLCQ